MSIHTEITLCVLLFFMQGFLIYLQGQRKLSDEKELRGLSAASTFCALMGFFFVRQLFPNWSAIQVSWYPWILAALFLLDMLLGALIRRTSSLHDQPWAIKAGSVLGRFFKKLTSWVPEPLDKEKEKEIVLTPVVRSPEVLENAVELSGKTVDEFCTHRSDVITLSLKDSPSRWRQIILENRHTFYPVTNENEDDIVGVLDSRDYFRLNALTRESILKNTVDRPLFVAENYTPDALIRQLKASRSHFAVVLDEYGGMTGIVTLHDIIEEILGEMQEPEDTRRPASIVKLPRGVWRIAGSAELSDVSKALGQKLECDDFETFSGYVLGSLGYIPEDGTQLEVQIDDLDVQIKSIKNHRIAQTLVKKRPDPAAEPSGTPQNS